VEDTRSESTTAREVFSPFSFFHLDACVTSGDASMAFDLRPPRRRRRVDGVGFEGCADAARVRSCRRRG
jgi:hypothetical protein